MLSIYVDNFYFSEHHDRMNTQNELMKAFGLTANEARVYLHGLTKTLFTPQTIARDEDIPRPTIYHVLQTLIQKGLMTKTKSHRGYAFTATHPTRLPLLLQHEKERFDVRRQSLDVLLPALQKKRAIEQHVEETIHYEGMTGVKLLFEEALYCKKRSWQIIAPSQNILRQVDNNYADYIYEAQRTRGIELRTLWENKMHDTKHSPEEIRRRHIRLMPKAMTGRFSSLVILFDDATAIFPPLDESSAILIRSKEIHATFDAIFEGLWELGTPYTR